MTIETKVALVTGAASGIGQACARLFAERGHSVVLADRDREGLDSTALLIGGANGEALAVEADASSSGDMAAAVETAVSRYGRLDVAVSAAGIARQGLVTDMAESEWDDMIGVNLTGTFLLARHAMHHLIASGAGSFVAVSSDAGVRGSVGFAAYCASKHGVVGLVRCLALDYGQHGVRSNVVCPTMVDTPMADALISDPASPGRAFYEKRAPMGRFAQPCEVAEVIAHLSSDEAAYTNGLVYMVDGGTTAGTFDRR
jgi:NAD(P)-dependent dehydrogenase (short-subunit alcohol dehydrogenase family)